MEGGSMTNDVCARINSMEFEGVFQELKTRLRTKKTFQNTLFTENNINQSASMMPESAKTGHLLLYVIPELKKHISPTDILYHQLTAMADKITQHKAEIETMLLHGVLEGVVKNYSQKTEYDIEKIATLCIPEYVMAKRTMGNAITPDNMLDFMRQPHKAEESKNIYAGSYHAMGCKDPRAPQSLTWAYIVRESIGIIKPLRRYSVNLSNTFGYNTLAYIQNNTLNPGRDHQQLLLEKKSHTQIVRLLSATRGDEYRTGNVMAMNNSNLLKYTMPLLLSSYDKIFELIIKNCVIAQKNLSRNFCVTPQTHSPEGIAHNAFYSAINGIKEPSSISMVYTDSQDQNKALYSENDLLEIVRDKYGVDVKTPGQNCPEKSSISIMDNF